jgi:signal transduction histidine kinase
LRSIKELPTKYPAIISGYLIYMYLFMVLIRFFITAKHRTLTVYNIIEMFSALPFMWLLAMMWVKVLKIRTRLHDSETRRAAKEQEVEIKGTQLATMREVALGLQHQINNPLAIMTLTLGRVRRAASLTNEITDDIDSIERESRRISQALKDFTRTRNYVVEQVDAVIGTMAVSEKAE